MRGHTGEQAGADEGGGRAGGRAVVLLELETGVIEGAPGRAAWRC